MDLWGSERRDVVLRAVIVEGMLLESALDGRDECVAGGSHVAIETPVNLCRHFLPGEGKREKLGVHVGIGQPID